MSLRTLLMSGLARAEGSASAEAKNEGCAGQRMSNSGRATVVPGLADWSVGAPMEPNRKFLLNELTDGMVGSVDAVIRAEIGPYRKSR